MKYLVDGKKLIKFILPMGAPLTRSINLPGEWLAQQATGD